MISLQDFINQDNGKGVDYDGVYGDQCVDLVQFWGQNLGLQPFHGNAVDLVNQAETGTVWVGNTPTNFPAPGDIVVWNANVPNVTGEFGHTAIAVNATEHTLQTFDQNWPTGSLCHLQAHSYDGVAGWLHPTILNQSYMSISGQATTVSVGVRVRSLPSVSAPDNQGTGNLGGNVTVTVTGYKVGDNVNGNDIWYRSIHGNWMWSGGFTIGAALAGGQGGSDDTTSEATETIKPVLPEAAVTVGPPQPEYLETYVPFLNGAEDKVTITETMAIDASGVEPSKLYPVGTRFKLAGTFTDAGRDYYRGTSGSWYGVPVSAFHNGQPQGNVPVKVKLPKGTGLIADISSLSLEGLTTVKKLARFLPGHSSN